MNFRQALTLFFLQIPVWDLSPLLAQSPIIPIIMVPVKQVNYSITLEAPNQTNHGTASCILEHRGVILAKPIVRSQNTFQLQGTFTINFGIPQIQMNCSLDGYENIEGTLDLVNDSFVTTVEFKRPKLIQSVQVDLDQDVATVQLKIPKWNRRTFALGSDTFVQLSTDTRDIQINSYQAEPKLPQYPQTNLLLALPLDATVDRVEVIPGPVTEKVSMLLAPKAVPGQGGSLFDEDPDFDPSSYFSRYSEISIIHDTSSTIIKDNRQNLVQVVSPLVDVSSKNSMVRFYEDLTIKVHFTHSSPCFRRPFPNDEVDRYKARPLRGLEPFVLNVKDILNVCRPGVVESAPMAMAASQPTLGPNLILVSPHAFTGQLTAFKEHKENLGIRTAVLEWNGTDPLALKTLLNQAYNLTGTNFVQWILLLGDVKAIPTYYDKSIGDINFGDFANSAGDLFYTQFPPPGLPYLASQETRVSIGRIPAKTPEELNAVLNRIMNFEKNPPTSDVYYKSPTLSGTLEIDPANPTSGRVNNFAEILEKELAKPWLLKKLSPERIYRPDRERGLPKYWSGHESSALIDYQASTEGDSAEKFHMNGTQTMIDSAWVRGTNLLVNSGHASTLEWSNPGFRFEAQRFSLFPVDRPPFILSLSCLTGLFDSETLVDSPNILSEESPFYSLDINGRNMAEQILLSDRGPLGVIAATRKTLVSLNNSMLRGFARAVIDRVDKENKPIPQDWGRILNYARHFSKIEMGYPDSSKTLRHQFLVYNLLGDPSLEFRQTPPLILKGFGKPVYDSANRTLRLPFKIAAIACPGCSLDLQTDSEIAVLRDQNNQVVSRAVVRRSTNQTGYNREIVWTNVQTYNGNLFQITVSGAGLGVQTHRIDNRIL